MTKYLTAAALLAPMVMARGASSYGLIRPTLLRRPLVVWSPSIFEESWPKMPDFPASHSPKYEITNTDDKFQLTVDVPGLKKDEIHVNLENDGQVLTLHGEHEENTENSKYSSKFYQSFTLDPTIVKDEIKASLKDGVLTLSAPKDPKLLEESVQKIPITHEEHSEDLKVEMNEEVKDDINEDVKVEI